MSRPEVLLITHWEVRYHLCKRDNYASCYTTFHIINRLILLSSRLVCHVSFVYVPSDVDESKNRRNRLAYD